MEHDINPDVEVMQLIEDIDDAVDNAIENFLTNFAERQMNDYIDANGATEEAILQFSDLENEIMRRALVVIRTRWERAGN